MIKYINETQEEALEIEIKLITRGLSRAMRDMGIYKSDNEVWNLSEEYVRGRNGLR